MEYYTCKYITLEANLGVFKNKGQCIAMTKTTSSQEPAIEAFAKMTSNPPKLMSKNFPMINSEIIFRRISFFWDRKMIGPS